MPHQDIYNRVIAIPVLQDQQRLLRPVRAGLWRARGEIRDIEYSQARGEAPVADIAAEGLVFLEILGAFELRIIRRR